MVRDLSAIPTLHVDWKRAVRIIRSIYPPIDLFEDIADPADWSLLTAAEQKTNPRLMETIGNLDLVPPERRVSGQGASYLMAPFTHVSTDRPSRFSDGSFGLLYVGLTFDVALFETMHHHTRFMAATDEAPGWTSQFREIVLDVQGDLRDIDNSDDHDGLLAPDSYVESQALGEALRAAGAEGIHYPSVRLPNGKCAALMYPDLASNAVQGRHLDYHWDGRRVDLFRDAGSGDVYRIV